jgi:hypothetical protein
MNYILGSKLKGRCDGSTAHINMADLLPGGQQLRAGLLVNGRIHPQPNHRPGVSGVDDGIHTHIRYVISYDLKGHTGNLLILI